MTTGTAANALSLATVAPPYGAVFCHQEAHINVDECGAPTFFSGGAVLVPLHGEHGRLEPAAFGAALAAHPTYVHSVQPAALSLTQATELGTAYRPAQIRALAELAHERGLKVHMDGARFANALCFLGCHPGDITWRAGVDVLSLGATKNGALAAEAVVFFDTSLVRDFELRRKRAGHLLSKSRYVAAQLLAYLESGVWRRNAERTNRLAQSIGQAAGAALLHPVEANEVFLNLGVGRAPGAARGRLRILRLGRGECRRGAPGGVLGPARGRRAGAVRGTRASVGRLQLAQSRGHRDARGAHRREQSADEADGERPLEPAPQQGR